MKKQCPLCQTQANEFFKDTQTYYKCHSCYGIFVDKDDLVDKQSEKERYELHSDDAEDEGYRKFVSPITSSIMNDYLASDEGLDFGAGTSTIIASVLNEYDYDIKNYDPFFHNFSDLLEKKYDYISSCEVIEHFYNPYQEFKLLKSMLKKSSKMYLMTGIYNEGIDFASWYYKNDPTHVFFYSKATFQWIKKEFGFSSVKVDKKLVVFEN